MPLLRSSIRQKDEIRYPDIAEDPALHISVIQSHPLWLVREMGKGDGGRRDPQHLHVQQSDLLLDASNQYLKDESKRPHRKVETEGVKTISDHFFRRRDCAERSSAHFRTSIHERRSLYHSG